MRIRGECRCHGVVVEGEAGTKAQPRPYAVPADILSGRGPLLRCIAVVDVPGGMAHDVPLSWPKGVERLTTQEVEWLDD